MRDIIDRDLIKSIIFYLLYILVLYLIIHSFFALYASRECVLYSELNHLQYKFDFITGCYVNHPQFGWLKLANLQNVLLGR